MLYVALLGAAVYLWTVAEILKQRRESQVSTLPARIAEYR